MSFFLLYKSHHLEVTWRHTHAHTQIAHFFCITCISLCIMFFTAHPVVAMKVPETQCSDNLDGYNSCIDMNSYSTKTCNCTFLALFLKFKPLYLGLRFSALHDSLKSVSMFLSKSALKSITCSHTAKNRLLILHKAYNDSF